MAVSEEPLALRALKPRRASITGLSRACGSTLRSFSGREGSLLRGPGVALTDFAQQDRQGKAVENVYLAPKGHEIDAGTLVFAI